MLTALVNKFPNLKIYTQKKYVRDRYSITVKVGFHDSVKIASAIRYSQFPHNRKFINGLSDGSYQKQVVEWIEKNSIPFRLESGQISLYLENLDLACEIIDTTITESKKSPKFGIHPACLERVSAVPDDLDYSEVVAGPVLKKYKIKVLLRDFDTREQQAFIGILKNHSDRIRCCGDLADLVCQSPFHKYYLTNGYFYSNDEPLITFLSLSSPALIKKIYRVTEVVK